MAARCVNIQHDSFKELAKQIGFGMAKSLTAANDYVIPTVDEAVSMIRANKVKQFKSAIAYIRTLKSPTVEDLLKGLNGIVREYNGSYYVVNGARIAETPAPVAAVEVEQANIKFLQTLNDTFGNIFVLSGKPGAATGLKLITGSEEIKAGTPLPTRLDKNNLTGDVEDDVASYRNANTTMASAYLKNAQWFAEGFIPGPPSMKNNVKLPYANKAIASRLAKLREDFNKLGTSKVDKAKKETIKDRMFKLADTSFQEFKDAIKMNLNAIFDAWDKRLIDRSRHWYDGANRIAQNFASTYGISHEAASGMLAVLSPQNEWFNNISAADRVMDIMRNHLTTPVTVSMFDNAIHLSKGEPFEQVVRAMKEQLVGKSIGDILTLAENDTVYNDIAANMLRVVDLSIHGPEVTVVTPEGVASGIKTDVGGLVRFAWGSTSEIFKAMSIFQNPAIENISEKIGKGSKVRNFYNNIANPNSEKGHVTVDTHAMAAAFMNVISSEEASAMNLFRSGGSPIYALIKEAYQEIAKEKGLRPREVQSITWEAIRLLIKESDKTEANRDEINQIWQKVQNKKLTHEQAISNIIGRFNFGRPQWDRATVSRGNPEGMREIKPAVQQGNSYGDNLRGQQPSPGTDFTGLVERDLISETDKIKYMTDDGAGNYVFYHYSTKDLTKSGINPEKFGSNIFTSRSETLLAPASFYYTEPGVMEAGLGNFGHIVKVPKTKVYPFNEDPANFYDLAKERFEKENPGIAFDFNKQLAWVSVIASENGYDMTVAEWNGLRGVKKSLRAQSPIKLKPIKYQFPVPGTLNQISTNSKADFVSNRNKKGIVPIPYVPIVKNENNSNLLLLSEIESKTKDVGYKATIQAARDTNDIAAGVQYFVDKAVENPDKFDRDFGEEFTDKMIKLASNEKISDALESLKRLNPDDVSIPVLEQILQDRTTKKVEPGKALFSEPNEETGIIAEAYKKEKGIELPSGYPIYSLNVEYSKKIADAFAAMENQPNDPLVKAAYEAMAQETMDQFYTIQRAGYIVEIFEGKGEPYKNSQEMIADVRDNKHQYILSTEKDFGQNPITEEQRQENPLLRDSGEKDVNGKPLLVNDIFRYVHDFFGHTARGNSFGPIGEENAWDEHARMYTGLARRAMTTETRGQNSWVNFGPHMRNEDGSIKKKGDPGFLSVTERPFADQKSGLLPEEFSQLPEEKGEERTGFKVHPDTVKVQIDEQALADATQVNQEQVVEEPLGWKPVDADVEFQKLNEEQFSREQKMRFSLNSVINLLKTKFGVKVRLVNEPGSFWRGKYSKGVVTINTAYVSPDTPFHEVLHPFIDVIKKDNPELYNALLEEVKNSEEGKNEFEYVSRAYSELSEDEQWDEVLVQRLGRMSARQYLEKESTKTLFDRFVDWMKTTLAKLGIMTQSFRTNMTMEEFAELIVNPSFVFDLNRKIDSENHAERFSKLSNTFDDVINVVRQKLQADASSRTKNMTEDTARRKFFSGKTAEALAADPRDLKAIDNFIISSAANLKRLNEKFQEFKEQFDAKDTKSTDDLAKLSKLLNEIEDCVTLYEDVDLLIDAVMDEFPDAEDSIGNLKKNYRREAALINDYKAYAKELIVNWLMPHASSAINKAIATNRPFTIVSKSTYEAVQKELQSKGITDKRTILETAFRRELASYITTAKKDASAVTQFLGPILHSRDPLSALIGRAIVEEYTSALKKGLNIQERLVKLVRQARGLPVFNTNKDHFDFYAKYMRQADSYEYKGINEKGEPEYQYVKRWAFHEEYKWDEFYKSKREMEKKNGPAPSKNDVPKYEAWKKVRDAWYAANTVKTTDGYVPSGQYKNAEFAALQNDKLFVELYKAYKDANNKAGRAGLKYGIIPQNTYTNIKAEKGKVVQTAIEKLRLFIGEDDQVYFSQKNNLKEQKTVPLAFTRMVEEKDLSFDLLQSVVKYAVSAEKYNSISQIEPHVNILKNFIGGNASLAIDPRQAVKISSTGLFAMSKIERKIMHVDAERINQQLDSFLNDVIYGDSIKKVSLQNLTAKFKVVDKNGNVDIIKGFADMAQHIGVPNLDYHGFELGKERKIKDYTVTMIKRDWNFSVKKAANTLGLLTAFQQLALNPVAGVINILRAKLETFIEGFGGRYFTIGDALKAEGIYFKALGSGDFFEDLKGGKPSFLSDMLIEYDGIQGELYNELGKKISGSLANKLFRRNHLFFMQQGGEHYVQTQMMIAMMLHQKVKLKNGETISLFDAKQREYNGQLKMSDTDWTEQNDADFRQNVKFVNTNMHGNYNKQDKAMLQRTWWGSLLLMFRKHIYTGFASRYRGAGILGINSGGYVNYQTGNYTEGYYVTFMRGLMNQMRSLIEQKRMGQLSEDERYAFRKIAADFAALVLLMFAFKAFDDDDDDEEFNDYMALISRRLVSEGVQYTPVIGTLDLAKVVTNPAASVSTVDKIWDAFSQMISDPKAEYERSGPGYQAGQNKAAVKWGRAIPVYRQYINTVEPERLLQFYGKNSIWFLKPSAKKGEEGEQ